jgi:CBS domain-containing protein
MHVEDVMQTEVVTVAPEATLKEAAALLVEHRISGLPVVDAGGAVVGVVSEADILYKECGERAPRGLLAWFFDPGGLADARKLNARTVAQAMTSPATTIQRWRNVADAAKAMIDLDVNRLPVVHHDKLVGIVTRADLVRAFARTDEEIRTEIREDVLQRTLMLPNPGAVDIGVEAGAVTLSGSVERRYEAEVAAEASARIPGVVSVASTLTWGERED